MSHTATRPFAAGDTITYPHHGAGLVLANQLRTVLGQERAYLRILILHNNMVLHVPVDCTDQIGIEHVTAQAAIALASTGTLRVTPVHEDEVRTRLRALHTADSSLQSLLGQLLA